MTDEQELIGVKIFDQKEKFTKRVKVVLPKNYIQDIDRISDELKIPKRYIIWDALGNYLRSCREDTLK